MQIHLALKFVAIAKREHFQNRVQQNVINVLQEHFLGSKPPCIPCKGGTYSIHDGVSSCQKCPKGTYSYVCYSQCVPSPEGTYSIDGGSHYCIPCKVG